jgi:hypothetical protein
MPAKYLSREIVSWNSRRRTSYSVANRILVVAYSSHFVGDHVIMPHFMVRVHVVFVTLNKVLGYFIFYSFFNSFLDLFIHPTSHSFKHNHYSFIYRAFVQLFHLLI